MSAPCAFRTSDLSVMNGRSLTRHSYSMFRSRGNRPPGFGIGAKVVGHVTVRQSQLITAVVGTVSTRVQANSSVTQITASHCYPC
jgi:hypothetical protein